MIKENNIAKTFLIISLVIGSILVFLIPPFQSPDENSHFLKSYVIAQGKFYPTEKNNKIGYYIPKNLDNYIKGKTSYRSKIDKNYTYEEIYGDQLLTYDYGKNTFKELSTATTSLIAHIVPAIGVQLTDFIGSFDNGGVVGPAVSLQFARFISMVVYTIIGYFAIKITPKFKKSFFAILLLPSSLYFRSCVTYDSLLLVIVAFSLALMLKLYFDKDAEFNKKYFWAFVICGYILFNIKLVYSIIFLLMFWIPNEKFDGRKNKIKQYAIMILLVLVLTILFKIPAYSLKTTSDALAIKQTNFAKRNILKFIYIIVDNIVLQFKTQSYYMVGTYGLLDTYMPVLFVHLTYLFLIITIVLDIFTENAEFKISYRITNIVFTLLAIFGMYAMMYLSWTPSALHKIGGNIVSGIQGRYFLPLLFMVPLIFTNNFIKNKFKKFYKKLLNFTKKYEANMHYYVMTYSIIMIMYLFMRYYF